MIDLYLITASINALTAFSLGLFVYAKGRKSVHLNWFLMGICVAVWASLVGIERLVMDERLHVLLDRIEQSFAIWIAVFYLKTVILLIYSEIPKRVQITSQTIQLAVLMIALIVPTPLFIAGAKPQPVFGVRLYDVAGPLYFLFPLIYTLTVSYASYLLIEAVKITPAKKACFKLLMAGTWLGFLLGATAFPMVFDIPFSPLGFHFVWLYTLIVTYAIFKHQLWDIRIVIRKSLVYSLLITALTASYFGLVYGVERLLQITFGYKSLWVSLGAFASMTLLFQPLKVGIQRLVDWLIFRTPHEELVRQVERLQEQALQTEKLKAVSTMAAGMAHEIKNPLTALRTFTEFIPERQNDPAFLRKLHETFRTEVSRIETIVREVLEFSRPKTPQMKPVDPGRLIGSTLDLLSNDLLKHRVKWTVNCKHNGTTLHADADHLRQVLINLIQNAADAMPNGGTLTLATRNVNSHLELTVSDTGTGIPKGLLPKIFDPFVTTKSDGNGLGLAMVHSIIRAHGGTIRAESPIRRSADGSVAGGTTFTVSLPL